jgi:hypothetical protein
MKRVAVDIETLATTPTAAIVSIGIVIQNNLDPESRKTEIWRIEPMLAIGDRDPKTLEWWGQQDEIVKRVSFLGTDHPIDVCNSINFWLQTHIGKDDVRYYANPARFDFAILANLFARCGIEPFIEWRLERCQRSIEKELNDLGIPTPEFPHHFAHDPVADCIHQLDELNWMLGYLEGAIRHDQATAKAYQERPGL